MESIDTENAGNDIDNLQATDSFGNLFRDPPTLYFKISMASV